MIESIENLEDYNIYDFGSPQPKQLEVLKCDALHIGFGGARGGGKSWFIRYKAKVMAVCHPGIKQIIIRKTYPELKANHIKTLKKETQGFATYKELDKTLYFDNGSEIRFMYCNYDDDADRLQGDEFDIIYFDEATQLTEYQLQTITATLRGINDFPQHIYYTCNPGGVGHSYIKRIFIDKTYKEEEDPSEYQFVQSLVDDNQRLLETNPRYKKLLEALPHKQRQAWLHGDWDIFEGQYFEEFVDDPKHYKDQRHTHVIEPFDIPKHWNIYRSYDFGYSKPFSLGWWAIDEEGVMYRILELYGCTGEPDEGVKWSPEKQFNRIREIEREHPLLKGRKIKGSVADPAIWNKSTGTSINDTAIEYGILFNKGDNARLAGWMQFRYRLQFDENGYPRMYIFNTCKNFIRTIPLLRFSEKPSEIEDLDTTQEDHIADDTRYMCMEHIIEPMTPVVMKEPQDDPLNLLYGKGA